jgi:hypothetical protein
MSIICGVRPSRWWSEYVNCLDASDTQWQVAYTSLTIREQLGEGEFGRVLRATVAPTSLPTGGALQPQQHHQYTQQHPQHQQHAGTSVCSRSLRPVDTVAVKTLKGECKLSEQNNLKIVSGWIRLIFCGIWSS